MFTLEDVCTLLRLYTPNIRCKHHQYLAKIEMSFKDNPKIFWSYHKAFLGGRSGANSLISYNSVAAEKPEQKAELLNNYFCSVFLPATLDVNITPSHNSLTDMEISHIEVPVNEVRECLSNLDISLVRT